MVEGIMRIYPPSFAPATRRWKSIKDSPTFEYQWRGRETGEGEIQLGALEREESITFSKFGTKLEGLFDCPFIGGDLRFTGMKVTHGRGQALSSAYEWRQLDEDAWNEECVSSWH